MMDRIRKIITHNLLCLKLIRPDIEAVICNKIYRRLCLLYKDLAACDHASDQPYDIKTVKLNLIISKFQLIQGEKIFNHDIHLSRFVHNDVTVKFPALRVVIDPLFQPFCISLDQSDRSLKLMRDIPQEFISHILDLFLLLNILLKLIIRAL